MQKRSWRWYHTPLFGIVAAGFAIAPLTEHDRGRLASLLVPELEKALNQKITVQSTRWIFPSSIELQGVQGKGISISKVKIHLSLPRLVRNLRNPGEAVSQIEFWSPKTRLRVNPNGTFSSSLLPTKTPEGKQPPPPKALLVIHDGRFTLDTPVEVYRLDPVQIQIGLSEYPAVKVEAHATISGKLTRPTALQLNAHGNMEKGHYTFELRLPSVAAENVEPWIPKESAIRNMRGKLSGRVEGKWKTGETPTLLGNITWRSGEAQIQGQHFTDISARIQFTEKRATLTSLSARYNDLQLRARGVQRLAAPFTGKYRFRTSGTFENLPVDMEGKVEGSLQKVALEITEGAWGRNTIAGHLQTLAPFGKGEIDAALNLSSPDIHETFPEILGLSGSFMQEIHVRGRADHLMISTRIDSTNATLFGQDVRTVEATAQYQSGKFILDSLKLMAPDAEFAASGSIGSDLTFAWKAESRGLDLRGLTLFGLTHINVEKFSGALSGKLSEGFFRHPLKHLQASGDIHLGASQIGPQDIEKANGKFRLDSGQIQLEQFHMVNRRTSLEMDGSTAADAPKSHWKIRVGSGYFEDLPILSHFLPPEAGHWMGKFSTLMTVEGAITEQSFSDPALLLSTVQFLGWIKSENGSILGQKTKKLFAQFSWDGTVFQIGEVRWDTDRTKLFAKGSLSETVSGPFRFSLTTDLQTLRQIFGIEETMGGKFSFEFQGSGTLRSPEISGEVKLDRGAWKNIQIDRLHAPFVYKNQKIFFPNPVELAFGENRIQVRGSMRAENLLNLSNAPLDLQIDVPSGKIEQIVELAQKIERAAPIALPTNGKTSTSQTMAHPMLTDLPIDQFLKDPFLTIYRLGPKKAKTLLDIFESTMGASSMRTDSTTPSALPVIRGDLKGTILLRGVAERPTTIIQMQISSGMWETFAFDRLELGAKVEGEDIEIGNFDLQKAGGSLRTTGKIQLPDSGALSITLRDFPADILSIAFPNGSAQIGGKFRGELSISGNINAPELRGAVEGKQVRIGGTTFDDLKCTLAPVEGGIALESLTLIQKGSTSQIQGMIPYSRTGHMSLKGTLTGHSIALFNLFTSTVEELDGITDGEFSLTGSLDHPVLNGHFAVREGTAYVPSADLNLTNINGSIDMVDSKIQIHELNGEWLGVRQPPQINRVTISGSLDLTRAFTEVGTLPMNVIISPGKFFLSFPGLIQGRVDLREFSLRDALTVRRLPNGKFQTTGPNIQAVLTLSEASVFLPKVEREKEKLFNPELNIDVEFAQNVRLVGGDVANLIATDLTNLVLNMEVEGEHLRITGPWIEPLITGTLDLPKGSIHILGREFTVVPPSAQETYYPNNPERIVQNKISWSGGVGREGSIPKIEMVAKLDTVGLTDRQEPLTILSRVHGMPFVEDSTRAIQFDFQAFEQLVGGSTGISVQPARYSDAQLKVLLLPDFLKASLGLAKGSVENVNVNEVLGDYLNSRFQALFLRGIERQLEQRLGLQSFSLEYNIGREVTQALGSSTSPRGAIQERERSVGVGFVKNFFGRIFIDVRYRQMLEEVGETPYATSLNYQLTYKLSPTFSLIYYREPYSLTVGAEETYYKVTLRGTRRF